MLDSELLRERLRQLVRSRRVEESGAAAGEPPDGGTAAISSVHGATPRRPGAATADVSPSPWASERVRETRIGVEEFLPGGEWRDELGAVFVHERMRSAVERPRASWGRLETPPEQELDLVALVDAGLERALFLDLETGGFISNPVFLAGTMHWNGEDFVLRQYFARHYGEEGALIRALHEAAKGFEFLVTFNGKSYDAPFLASRAIVHGVRLKLPPRHLDLLHPSRRRWKLTLPNCRLQTLELHVCRKRRSGDVPSDEVPQLYHDFVRSGDPYRLIPVFHHNMLDVITMGEILTALCAATPVPVEYHSRFIDVFSDLK